MADYFLSDVHLRLDRPDRGHRLAKLVETLGPDDLLVVVGDLCDFWFAARQHRPHAITCPGLQALLNFHRRGGRLIVVSGNHDRWLGEFYKHELGATWIADELRMESYGLRVQITHGHRFGARSVWKAAMESRLFLRFFATLPARIAERLESGLEHSNDKHRTDDDRKHVALYRKSILKWIASADMVVLGHIHLVLDEIHQGLRMIVLGNWDHQISYLRIDDKGAELVTEAVPSAGPLN